MKSATHSGQTAVLDRVISELDYGTSPQCALGLWGNGKYSVRRCPTHGRSSKGVSCQVKYDYETGPNGSCGRNSASGNGPSDA